MKIRDLVAGVPEGLYRARLAKTSQTTSQAGRPMYILDWEIVDPPAYAGQTVRDWLVLTGEGLRRWASLYLAMGGSPDDEVSTVAELAERCLAKARQALVWVEVETRPGNDGVPRPRVRAYHAPEQGQVLAAQYARRESMVPF